MVMIQYCENSKNQEVELLKIGKKRCKKSKYMVKLDKMQKMEERTDVRGILSRT